MTLIYCSPLFNSVTANVLALANSTCSLFALAGGLDVITFKFVYAAETGSLQCNILIEHKNDGLYKRFDSSFKAFFSPCITFVLEVVLKPLLLYYKDT